MSTRRGTKRAAGDEFARRRQLPILWDTRVIWDSLAIMEWLATDRRDRLLAQDDARGMSRSWGEITVYAHMRASFR